MKQFDLYNKLGVNQLQKDIAIISASADKSARIWKQNSQGIVSEKFLQINKMVKFRY